MPRAIGSRVLVCFLQAPVLGFRFARRRENWPLHITLMPWFETDDLRLRSALEQIVARQKQFSVSIDGIAQFNATTHVSLLTASLEMSALHRLLVSTVCGVGGKIQDERFIGAQYRPHVTHHEGNPVPAVGTVIHINAVHMVRLLPDNVYEVEQCWPLEKSSEAAA